MVIGLRDSFARIFFRNAINLGLPLIVCKGISKKVKDGQTIIIDNEKGIITIEETSCCVNKLIVWLTFRLN